MGGKQSNMGIGWTGQAVLSQPQHSNFSAHMIGLISFLNDIIYLNTYIPPIKLLVANVIF
jgi:hypothetical protein